MTSNIAAKQLLDAICNTDKIVERAMRDEDTMDHVLNELSVRFENIVNGFPHLVEDIQKRIVKYHCNKGEDGKITDFISLVEWYSMSLSEHSTEWWDVDGKYYGIRMDEVINMFLIARFNFGLV